MKCPNCGAPLEYGKCSYCGYKENVTPVETVVIKETIPEYSGPNLFISRGNKKPWGEANTHIIIDGTDYGELSTDRAVDIPFRMSAGWHTIQFRRAALKSEKLKFEAYTNGIVKYIVCTPNGFSISVTIR